MATNLNIFGKSSEKLRNIFADTWKNNAQTSIQRYDVAREFWALILGFIVLRLSTSFVSIFSGYAFFNVELCGVLPSETLRKIAAVLLLICIELITAGFLFKLFKFIFAQRWQLAASMLVGVCVFFFISFHTSTAGIALYMSDTSEQKITLENKSAAGVDSVSNFYDNQISILNASLEQIKPQTWNKRRQKTADGRDTTVYLLTTQQENTKTEIYNKILSLQNAKSSAIADYRASIEKQKTNIQTAANIEADKYYIYVVIIMLLQLSSNGVLCYFYSRIYHENNRDQEVADVVADFAEVIADNTDALINRQTTIQYNNYVNNLERRLLMLQASSQISPSNETSNKTFDDVSRARARYDFRSSDISSNESNETSKQESNKTNDDSSENNKTIIKGFAPSTDNSNKESSNDKGVSTMITPTADKTNKTNSSSSNNIKTVYVGNNIRYCAQCGAAFIPRHNKQIYCSDGCRGQACANRNGKTYYFAGKKYEPQTKKEN